MIRESFRETMTDIESGMETRVRGRGENGEEQLAKRTGMEFADAFYQIRSELGAQSREKKSAVTLGPEEQLANWRSQMTQAELDSLLPASVKGTRSQNLVQTQIC